jgi:hypothetical protein
VSFFTVALAIPAGCCRSEQEATQTATNGHKRSGAFH